MEKRHKGGRELPQKEWGIVVMIENDNKKETEELGEGELREGEPCICEIDLIFQQWPICGKNFEPQLIRLTEIHMEVTA